MKFVPEIALRTLVPLQGKKPGRKYNASSHVWSCLFVAFVSEAASDPRRKSQGGGGGVRKLE